MSERTVRFGDERLPKRFWDKVQLAPNGCWLWTGTTTLTGYGGWAWNNRTMGAHQWAYEKLVGPIPEGFDVEHRCHSFDLSCPGGVCDHRRCVNPNDHLEAVTHRENLLRGRTLAAAFAARDMCANGHPFDDKNTQLRADGRGVARRCRQCQRETRSRYVARRRAA